jgi:hypothetical protein
MYKQWFVLALSVVIMCMGRCQYLNYVMAMEIIVMIAYF